MRLLPALILVALLAPIAQAGSALRVTGSGPASGAGRIDGVLVATPYTASPTASIPFKVDANGDVRFQLRVGATDGRTLAVTSPLPCRQTVEAGAGTLLTFTCPDMMAGQYTLRVRSDGRVSSGVLRATGATFQAPTTPV